MQSVDDVLLQFGILTVAQLADSFPYFIHIAGRTIHPHLFFESLAYVVALGIFVLLRAWQGDSLLQPIRWIVIAAAFVGATLGSKLLFLFEDPGLTLSHLHDPSYLMGGKTIVGGLLGGLFAVEAMKKYVGVHQSTGDLFAIPLAVGIAIGRIGCFLTGLSDNTYGTATSLPWGIDSGDGVMRHPTQLYEIVFLVAMIPVLYWITRHVNSPETHASSLRAGDAFRAFMIGYLGFRLFCDFIKPYQRVTFGLGAIQWACVLGLAYYLNDMSRWLKGAVAGR